MATKNLDIVISAKDEASATLQKFSTNITSFAKDAAIGSGIIIAALSAVGKSIIDTAGNMEQARVSFETMLGSGDKAGKLLKQLSDFAVKTPFDLPQVVEGSKRLLAYNIEAEKIIPTFEMLGNIAAGVGTDKLPQLILAFGQVRAATRLTGMELRQFSEAGVPLLSTLAKQFNTTEAAVTDMISDKAVKFEDVEKALASLTGEGGKFFHLMEKQSLTFQGVLSNVRDEFVRFALAIVGFSEEGLIRDGSLFYYLKIAADAFLRQLQIVKPIMIDFVNNLLNSTPAVTAVISALAAAFTVLAIAMFPILAPAVALMGIFGALGYVAGLIIDYFGGIEVVSTKLGETVSFLKSKWDEIYPRLQDTANLIMEVLAPAWEMLRTELSKLWEEIKKTSIETGLTKEQLELLAKIIIAVVVAAIYLLIVAITLFSKFVREVVLPIVNQLIAAYNFLSEKIKGVVSSINDFIDSWGKAGKLKDISLNITRSIKDLVNSGSSHQHGGFVDAPVGQAVPAILHGQERVIPRTGTDVNPGMGSGGMGITINFTGAVNMDNPSRVQELADKVISILGRQNELASRGVAF